MTAFVKSDLRQTVDYGASFNQYLFDLLSKLVDKSNEQVRDVDSSVDTMVMFLRVKRLRDSVQ